MHVNDEQSITSVVIFGASGDLTTRKLIPALFNNFRKGRIRGEIQIVGSARRPMTHVEFRDRLRGGVTELAGMECPPDEWVEFSKRIWYIPGDE